MGEENSRKMEIDFTKMDASIKELLDVLMVNHKNKMQQMQTETPKQRVKKKLNVDLIRQVLQETREIQKNKTTKNNNN